MKIVTYSVYDNVQKGVGEGGGGGGNYDSGIYIYRASVMYFLFLLTK